MYKQYQMYCSKDYVMKLRRKIKICIEIININVIFFL